MKNLKEQAFDYAISDMDTVLVRHIKTEEGDVLLLVNKDIPDMEKGEEILDFHFKTGAGVCIISEKDYKNILSNKIKLADGWELQEVLFDGVFEFSDIEKMVESIRNYPWVVEIDDRPAQLKLGFKGKSGVRWSIGLVQLKESISRMSEKKRKIYTRYFSSQESKKSFLNMLNTKPVWIKN